MQAMEKDKYKNSLNEQEKLTLEYLSKQFSQECALMSLQY